MVTVATTSFATYGSRSKRKWFLPSGLTSAWSGDVSGEA